jgi:hypothetical protein
VEALQGRFAWSLDSEKLRRFRRPLRGKSAPIGIYMNSVGNSFDKHALEIGVSSI